MTQKGGRFITGHLEQLYDPKGHGDIFSRMDLGSSEVAWHTYDQKCHVDFFISLT